MSDLREGDALDVLIRQLRSAAPPATVVESARLLVLDTVGCALAGLQAPPVRAFAAHAARLDTGPVPWPGSGEGPQGRGLSVHGACQALSMAACWDEACEGLAYAHGRPGVPVVAAVLALASTTGCTWPRALEAVVLGYEIGGRMGATLRIKPGMHVDAGWPALGAAAAAAHLMGADERVVRSAIELAAAQLPFGLYLPIAQGADGRNTYLGHAACLGVHAAMAAVSGVCAPRGAVDEHARIALGREAPVELEPAGRWLLSEGYLKRWPAVRHVHYAIAAAQAIRDQWGRLADGVVDPSTLRRIALRVYPEALTYCGNRAPRTPIQAQFSLSFGVATALARGDLDVSAYRDPTFTDPVIRRLEGLVRLQADPDLGRNGQRAVWLEVETAQGYPLRAHVDSVDGDAARPLTRDAVRAKFIRYAGQSTSPGEADQADQAGQAAQAADSPHGPWSLDTQSRVGDWWRQLVVTRPATRPAHET